MKTKATLPPIAEWDFSSIEEGELRWCIVWEMARSSDRIRAEILAWLDSPDPFEEDSKTIRNALADASEIRHRLAKSKLALTFAKAAGISLKKAAPVSVTVGNFPIDSKGRDRNSAPAKSDPCSHSMLWNMLNQHGHLFPTPWLDLPIWIRREYSVAPKGRPVSFIPGTEFLGKMFPSDPRIQRGAFAGGKEILSRSTIVQIDFERAKKDDVLELVGDWFDREIIKLSRTVKGQAGREPWSFLTQLSALRLLETLTAPQATKLLDDNRKSLAKRPNRFVLPPYFDKGNWSDAKRKARAAIERFESEVSPSK